MTAFQISVMATCFAIWTIQIWELLSQYYKFPTVASIRINRPRKVDLPSITICIPTLVSRRKLEAWYRKAYPNDTDSFDSTEALKIATLNSTSLLFDLSISSVDLILKCEYWEPQLNNVSSWNNCLTSPVMESVKSGSKCFTLFSNLVNYHDNETNQEFSVYPKKVGTDGEEPDGLVLKMNLRIPDDDDLVELENKDISLTMHSSFYISTYESWRITILGGLRYDLSYTEERTIFQPEPYDTDCYNYSSTNAMTPESRIDCATRCTHERIRAEMNCTSLDMIVLKHHSDNLPVCHSRKERNLIDIYNSCNHNCKKECEWQRFVYFAQSYPIEKSEDVYSQILFASKDNNTYFNKSNLNKITVIKLWRIDNLILTYIYTPAQQLVSLLANIGGLAGVWFGFSIYQWLSKAPRRLRSNGRLNGLRNNLHHSLARQPEIRRNQVRRNTESRNYLGFTNHSLVGRVSLPVFEERNAHLVRHVRPRYSRS